MARLLSVLVGCNYADAQRPEVPPLREAEHDARHLSAFLATIPLPNGEAATPVLLLGPRATTENVITAIQEAVAVQSQDDTLLFYFSGHGSRGEDGLVLYTWDSVCHARDLLNELGDRGPVRVILDCCHAAAISP